MQNIQFLHIDNNFFNKIVCKCEGIKLLFIVKMIKIIVIVGRIFVFFTIL